MVVVSTVVCISWVSRIKDRLEFCAAGVLDDVFAKGIMLGFCGEFEQETTSRIVQLAQQGTESVPESCKIDTAGKTIIWLGMGLVYCWLLLTLLVGNISA